MKNIYEEKKDSPTEKCAKEVNRHFTKEDHEIGNIHMKRYSTSFIISELESKTTMVYYFTHTRIWKAKEVKQRMEC